MRMLLMISNNQMSLRELYTTILDTHPAGWFVSFMSGMPGDAASIVSGYDAAIYELGAADSPARVTVAADLRRAGLPVITHVEGRNAAQYTQELAAAGVFVVANPLSASTITSALDDVAEKLRSGHTRRKEGFGARFLRVFTG